MSLACHPSYPIRRFITLLSHASLEVGQAQEIVGPLTIGMSPEVFRGVVRAANPHVDPGAIAGDHRLVCFALFKPFDYRLTSTLAGSARLGVAPPQGTYVVLFFP